MIIVQLVHHFRARRFEWFMALAMFAIGRALADPGDTFDRSLSYALLAAWASEETWAWLLTWTGTIRLVILVINGVFLRRAAEVRAVLGVWSFSVTAMLATGFHSAPVEGSIIAALMTLMAVFELSNIWTAVIDAHDRRTAGRYALHNSR